MSGNQRQRDPEKARKILARPVINPLPEYVEGLDQPRVSLNGSDWKINLSPPQNFYGKDVDISGWNDVTVPGDTQAEGREYIFSEKIETDRKEYAFARRIEIPKTWKGYRIFLRFDGVCCLARVFLNGVFLTDHYGGFVSWDCEITSQVVPGGENLLVLGVTDRPEINPFHRGGIIRDVTLYALPTVCISHLQAETVFDPLYRDAVLRVSAGLSGGNGNVRLSLATPSREGAAPGGEGAALGVITLKAGEYVTGEYAVKSPHKWDSEHPCLYTLGAELESDGHSEKVSRKIGFRQIEMRGANVYINGDLIKLHGVNRHETDPLTGRSITKETAENDVRLFKKANVNFIRTSHYPPSPVFLDLCDEYGIYVEDETAVAFVMHGQEDDPSLTPYFIVPFAEMMERDYSHPSVIIWSLANESFWGRNMAVLNEYARAEDPQRLTIFSFPINQHEDDELPDIWSFHYSGIDRNLTAKADSHWRSIREETPMPVLHDESTHIPAYDLEALRRDPGFRDFWGETIKRFWDLLWEKDGALGCAIWAGIDDVLMGDTGGAAWGIIDGWRREKPEHWHTRKAYSPIRIDSGPEAGNGGIVLVIQNRFNHTNLKEIEIKWRLGDISGTMQGPDVPPRFKGTLVIPVAYGPGKTLEIQFIDHSGDQFDESVYVLDKKAPELPVLCGSAPAIKNKNDSIEIQGKSFSLVFSKGTGLITSGRSGDTLVLSGGPFLNLIGLPLGPWQKESINAGLKDGAALVAISGHYGKVDVRFDIKIDDTGLMETAYTITNMPYPSPRRIAISPSITCHDGGYDEVGISFTAPPALDSLSWEKLGLWNAYPEGHIGRLKGKAPKFNPGGANIFNHRPQWGWELDEKDWLVFGKNETGRRGVRDFTATKSYILWASLESQDAAFTALSDGKDSARMELCWNPQNVVTHKNPTVSYRGNWSLQNTRYRSLDGEETWSAEKGACCEYLFRGTGIVWVSSLDSICGLADVFIDDVLRKKSVDLGLSRTGKSARDHEKLYRRTVFAIQDLENGEHTIRIEVAGEKAPGSSNCYVNIDHFIVFDGNETGDTRFIINSEFNYPRIGWGNYNKQPITVASGYSRKIYTRL